MHLEAKRKKKKLPPKKTTELLQNKSASKLYPTPFFLMFYSFCIQTLHMGKFFAPQILAFFFAKNVTKNDF